MNLQEAIDLVRFQVDEDRGSNVVTVNDMWTDARIAYFIYEGQKEYAKRTKGIEGIETLATVSGQQRYKTSGLALKGQGYKRIYFLIGNNFYPVPFETRNAVHDFYSYGSRNYTSTYPQVVNFWEKNAYLYPAASTSPTTTLTTDLLLTDSVINLASTAAFSDYGVIQIDSEKILYNGRTATTLTIEKRGGEGTAPAAHANGATATFQSLYFELYKLPFKIPVNPDGTVMESVKQKELEIEEDDQNISTEYATWKCLEKDTDARWQTHKSNYEELVIAAQIRIIKSRQINRPTDIVNTSISPTMTPVLLNWR